ncbi:hypothetical protein ES703_110134 [subsurface metagenome]
MLAKKATETTHQIFGLLLLPNTSFPFVTIQPLILKLLESVYLQGRKDQVDKVPFKQLPDGSLKFQDK